MEPCTETALAISITIKFVYKFFYPTYEDLIKVDRVKQEIFEEFSKQCTWEPHHREAVGNNFHFSACQRLKDMLCFARETYKLKHDTPKNPYRPNWIGDKVWDKLLQHWKNDSTFKKRSAAHKANRKSAMLKGGGLHTMGSVSVISHAQELVKKNI